MLLSDQEVDRLLKEKGNTQAGVNDLIKELAKQVIERALNGEMTHYLGFSKHERTDQDNSRNGYSRKSVATPIGTVDVQIPRDRKGEFEPQIISKGQRRLPEIDERILALYARGLSTRDIQAHMQELYGIDVSPDLISSVTDSVVESIREWHNRPLESVYVVIYLDALWVKIRQNSKVVKKAVYLAIGISNDGMRDILGLWIQQQEGASFWMTILDELKHRGVEDILIACVDGLKGFEQAIKAVFPQTEVQLCIVHLIRNSLRFVTRKDKSALVHDLKNIYRAINVNHAEEALGDLESKWKGKYPHVVKIWKNNWDLVAPCLSYPSELRRIVYTTNTIESVNKRLRKVLKTKGSFPSDLSVEKILYLSIINIVKKWNAPILAWKQICSQLEILYEGRLRK